MKITHSGHGLGKLIAMICWLVVSLPVGAVLLTGQGVNIPTVNLDLYSIDVANQLVGSNCKNFVDITEGPITGYDPIGNVVFTGSFTEIVGRDAVTGAYAFCFFITNDQSSGLTITDVGLSDVSGFSLAADYLFGDVV